ncbi:hypothetical protein HPB52_010391 [Rhipicephalus sanguineus]|uniref:Uncharacterized protein n=1 Tax=Rhipicephalus sanguineus TaxID=34632 RepID=A0A9D4QED6_RHISA|nr:hypothetical protein HPB52_010391 [Rhipicephalus sanguineus]
MTILNTHKAAEEEEGNRLIPSQALTQLRRIPMEMEVMELRGLTMMEVMELRGLTMEEVMCPKVVTPTKEMTELSNLPPSDNLPLDDTLRPRDVAAFPLQRPIPPESLLCTYGEKYTGSSAFPDDGVCDFTALEATPFSEASDFGGPYPAAVENFIDTAAKYQKTEFALCLDYA